MKSFSFLCFLLFFFILQNNLHSEIDDFEFYNNEGLRFKMEGRVEAAQKNFEFAIESDNKNIEGYNNLATLLLEHNKNLKYVSTLCKKALALQPDNIDAKANFAIYLFKIGEFQKSEVILLEILNSDPLDLVWKCYLYPYLVEIYMESDLKENEIELLGKNLEKILFWNPQNKHAMILLAIILMRTNKNLKKIEKLLDDLWSFDIKSIETITLKEILAKEMGLSDLSLILRELAMFYISENPNLWHLRGQIFKYCGKLERAKIQFKKGVAFQPEFRTYEELSKIQFLLKENKDATVNLYNSYRLKQEMLGLSENVLNYTLIRIERTKLNETTLFFGSFSKKNK